MINLDAWWAALTNTDRALFAAHTDTSPLPAEVAQRARETSLIVPAAVASDRSEVRFDWPEQTAEFLRRKAAERAEHTTQET
ncbi:hypothetical protein [Verrucosispora sp. TAA-831]|uniref:hypothetical protein n=1 Tax=Verrucosispora sp. TAA-831 TaxID=3422227 RepID=UPI003D6FCA66